MKLTTVVIAAAALAAAAGAAGSAAANATIFDKYDYTGIPPEVTSDGAVLFVTNTGTQAFTDVSISGGFAGGSQDFGALAAGASTAEFYMGDNEYGTDGTALVSIVFDGVTYSGDFSDVLGDIDVDTAAQSVGSLTIPNGGVPEPGAWALILAGFAGLGAAMRLSRRKTPATA